jgi:putative modified peptide
MAALELRRVSGGEELLLRPRPIDVSVHRYGVGRLVRLLQLLRPAPHGWLAKAQRIALDFGVLTDHDLAAIGRKLESDPIFRQRFDSDPVAASKEIGMRGLALRLEREMRELVALAERLTNDEVFRSELDTEPAAALAAAGMPEGTAEPFLHALDASDEVLAKLPEVVAHQHEHVPPMTRLLILLLGSNAVAETLRAKPPET